MALATATISFDLADILGVDFDARRTKVWVDTNVPNDTIVDTVGNQIRLGSGSVTIAADGTGSVVVWVPGAGSNPASWQTTVHVDYPDSHAHGGRSRRDFGPYTITASANLADLVDEQEVPPTYLSALTTQLDEYATDAANSAAIAQSAADLAQSISGIDSADDAITLLDATPSSDFRVAQDARLSATYAAASDMEVTDGEAQRQGVTGTARTVAFTGHSLVYAQDTSVTGTTPATNGASQTRSSTPTTAQMQTQANFLSPGSITVVNQGYPGDRTTEALTRWVDGVSGLVEFFWLDANDGNNYGGFASGTLTDAQTRTNLRALVKRARGRGASVVVVGGAPIQSDTESRRAYASAQTERSIAERLGAQYVDAGELLGALVRSKAIGSDAVHLSPESYSLVGARLAALLGPKGINPPKAAPGRVLTPRDRVTKGGTLTARSGSADGNVWQLTTGNALGLSVDVTAPCVPVFRFRVEGTTIGYGRVGLFYNLGTSGQPNRYFTITAPTVAATGYVYVVGQPLLSPGPDSLVVRCESGSVELDSVRFVPVDRVGVASGDSFDWPRYRPLNLHPVGGRGGRSDASWDAMADTRSGVSLRRNGASSTANTVKWQFDLRLGWDNSGVILAQAVNPGVSYLVQQGYMLIRSGTSLIVRKLENSTATDTTVTSVFASATGYVSTALEVVYDGTTDTATVYVDGTSRATITPPAYTFLMAGLITGSTTGGFASGVGSVFMKDTSEYL